MIKTIQHNQETAIEIARASSLILPTMKMYVIEGHDEKQVEKLLQQYYDEVQRAKHTDLVSSHLLFVGSVANTTCRRLSLMAKRSRTS